MTAKIGTILYDDVKVIGYVKAKSSISARKKARKKFPGYVVMNIHNRLNVRTTPVSYSERWMIHGRKRK